MCPPLPWTPFCLPDTPPHLRSSDVLDAAEAAAGSREEAAAPLDSQASTMTGSALDYTPLDQMVSRWDELVRQAGEKD